MFSYYKTMFMKLLIRNLLLACCLFVAGTAVAQPPAGINFQAVAKDAMNNVAKNRPIYVKIAIFQKSVVNGINVWEEAFETTSNDDGLFLVVIGQGTKTSGTLLSGIDKIDWANGPFFVSTKVAVAPSIPAPWWLPADNYVDIGSVQMMSVPYALFAGNASVTNVNTSIPPGPNNTFLITDSAGNVNWAKPAAAQQSVTTITNFNLNFVVSTGTSIDIPANTTAVASVTVLGVRKGDPILVTAQDDYTNWAVYSAWVSADDTVMVRFANYTEDPVSVNGSQYKIVVIK